jgi:hypothetical protein
MKALALALALTVVMCAGALWTAEAQQAQSMPDQEKESADPAQPENAKQRAYAPSNFRLTLDGQSEDLVRRVDDKQGIGDEALGDARDYDLAPTPRPVAGPATIQANPGVTPPPAVLPTPPAPRLDAIAEDDDEDDE